MTKINSSSLLEYAIKELKNENFRLKDQLNSLTETSKGKDKFNYNLLIAALESAVNSVVLTDASGVIIWTNPAFTLLTGYSLSEVIGATPSLLKSGKHSSSFYKNIWETIKNGKVWSGKLINKRKNGSLYHEEMTITPVKDDAGIITNFIAIKNDISERIEQERILEINQSSVENSTIGIVWANMDSKIVYSNKIILELTGYSREEISKLNITDIDLNWPSKEFFDKKIIELKQLKSLHFETELLTKNQDILPVHIILNLINYNDEELIIAYIKDIRKQKAVRDIEELLIKSESLNEFLEGVHATIDRMISAPNFYIALIDEQTDFINFPYFKDQHDPTPSPRKKAKGLTEYVIKSKEPFFLTKEVFDTLVKSGEIIPVGTIPHSYIAVPLFAQSRAMGLMVLQSYDNSLSYNEQDLDWISSIGTLLSTAIQRKLTEDKLTQFRKTVENAAMGILWLNDEGKIIYANKSVENKLELSSNNLKSVNVQDLFKQKSDYLEQVLYDLKTKDLLVHELQYTPKKGKNVSLEITYNSFKLDDKEIIIAYIKDNTNRKQAERKIVETNNKLEAITNSTTEAIVTIDKDSKIILWNKASTTLFDYKESEVLGKKLNNIIKTNDFINNFDQICRDALSIGKDFTGKVILECDKKNGNIFQAELSLSLTELNKEWYITTVFRDLSELNKIQEFSDFERDKYINNLKNEIKKIRSDYSILDSIINTLPQKIYIKDSKSRYIKLNNSSVRQMGFNYENELIGKSDLDVFDIESAEQFIKEEKDIMALQKPIIGREHEEFLKDGRKFWAQTSKFPLLNKEGKTIGTFGITNDVTEKKLAEIELQDNQYKFRKLIENAAVGIMRLDIDGEIIMANPMLVHILKYNDEAELLAKTSDEIFGLTNQKEYLLKYLEKEKKVVAFENVMINSNGERIDVRQNAWSVFDNRNNFIYYEVVVEDITEQNHILKILHDSEHKYRTLIDKLNQAVFLMIEDKIELANKKFADILGLDENELYSGKFKLNDFLTEESKALIDERRKKLTAGEELPNLFELTIINKKGEEREVEVSISHLYYEGKIARQGVLRDLTEVKKQETQIRHLQKMEAIGTLAAGIAHEINTPAQFINDNLSFLKDAYNDLNPILSLSKTIETDNLNNLKNIVSETDLDYLNEEIPIAIEQSIDGIQRIANIVGAMRDFAHTGPKNKQASDIHKIINNSITLSKNAWKYIAEIERDFTENMPNILCQPSDLSQVIVNIIVNASHALEKKYEGDDEIKGKINIKTEFRNEFVEVKISDNGTGMPEKVKKRIFDPFYTTKEVGKGTGQGLSIAHDIIVNKHGGTIEVESVEDEGTTFKITIPIQ